MVAQTWRPLLEGKEVQKALDLAEEIAEALGDPPPLRRPTDGVSLAYGTAGQALFLAYLERARPGKGWGDRAVDLIEQTMAAVAETLADPYLYSGFVGVAWVLEHLHAQLVDEGDDPGEGIVPMVERLLRPEPPSWEFDLIVGAVGLGVYAFERLPRPGAEECLRRAVDRLGRTAERADGKAAWKTPADAVPLDRRELFPHGYYFTGVAHGAAGVIAFLAEAHAAGVTARPLLDEAVAWLATTRMPPGPGPVHPYEVAPGATELRPTRLAWCHGDPGIAAALMGAARRVGEPAWEREALALARAAAARSAAENAVVDAGLCHGTAGLVHLFNRLYQATGDPDLAAAARFWLERTLAHRRPGEGVAGFLAWEQDENWQMVWRAEPGLLSGAAGIGLALLAVASPVEPAWDRVFLASIPPAPGAAAA
jgi:lantibiotic modifying enzyme